MTLKPLMFIIFCAFLGNLFDSLILIIIRQIFHSYGFYKVESKLDFENKLDKAIIGLE